MCTKNVIRYNMLATNISVEQVSSLVTGLAAVSQGLASLVYKVAGVRSYANLQSCCNEKRDLINSVTIFSSLTAERLGAS